MTHRRHAIDPEPTLSRRPGSFTAAEVRRLLSDPAEVSRAQAKQQAAVLDQNADATG
jgi:hypothetical protein